MSIFCQKIRSLRKKNGELKINAEKKTSWHQFKKEQKDTFIKVKNKLRNGINQINNRQQDQINQKPQRELFELSLPDKGCRFMPREDGDNIGFFDIQILNFQGVEKGILKLNLNVDNGGESYRIVKIFNKKVEVFSLEDFKFDNFYPEK